MQDYPLTISSIRQYGTEVFGDSEVATFTGEGVRRMSYAELGRRAARLANALRGLGVDADQRVATFQWNTAEHLEAYLAIPSMGAIMHTLNIRLAADQLVYIADHAEDEIIIVGDTLVPLLASVLPQMKTVRHVIVIGDADLSPLASAGKTLHSYEELLASASDTFDWPTLDERQAAAMCYTSGTTGNPKGVVYSHRSAYLHSMSACTGNAFALSAADRVLPVVPMFHANAWGLVYAAPFSGAKLVFPGPKLDGPSVYELLDKEQVTLSAGVPTVWLALLDYCAQNKLKMSSVKRSLIGGSAVPLAMIERFWKEHGIEVAQGWGMTEMSPLGTLTRFNKGERDLPDSERFAITAKQGRPVFGCEMKIIDDAGNDLPHDGSVSGNMVVRGPWIVKGYMKGDGQSQFLADDWFMTGDVCKIETDGSVVITDRSKDVIKSGGEWISSIDLENAAMGCPGVAEAAVIGVAHPKWDERPLLIVVKRPEADVTKDDLLKFLDGKIAKWWMPDDVQFIDQIPHGATGKILKTALRKQFEGYKLPTA
jgi:fatty-acyl-CoA synthase